MGDSLKAGSEVGGKKEGSARSKMGKGVKPKGGVDSNDQRQGETKKDR